MRYVCLGRAPRNANTTKRLYAENQGAISAGDAMGNPGTVCRVGAPGVSYDVWLAQRFYETAIELDDVNCTTTVKLGILMRDGGEGVEQNPERAVQLFEVTIK